MTSYQRRLQNIIFWKHRGDQLEEIIFNLLREIKKRDKDFKIPLIFAGINGDDQITDIDAGDFYWTMESELQKGEPRLI